MRKLSEKISRTVYKIISWRILMNISQFVGGLVVSHGDITIASKILIGSIIINTLCYYIHERGWNKIDLGKLESNKLRFYERIPRSLGKLVTWRILMTVTQFTIGYMSSGSINTALLFLGWATIVNSLIFFIHERVWNRISLGKQIIT